MTTHWTDDDLADYAPGTRVMTPHQEIQAHADQLRKSAKGRAALKAVRQLIDAGPLDIVNQHAVLALLEAGFGAYTGTVLDLCRSNSAG